jgi:integration host factor subunit beta
MRYAARGMIPRAAPQSARAPFTVRVFLESKTHAMTKSELIESLAARQKHLAANDVELAVKSVLEQMSQSLSIGERIEIRGFGSFSLHYRPPRMGRNPKTGDSVALPGKHVPHFKPGKELRERVNGKNGEPKSA